MNIKKNTLKLSPYAIFFWVVLWQIASMALSQEVLLPSPLKVLETLYSLIPTKAFWVSVISSSVRFGAGFVVAGVAGVLFATLAYRFKIVALMIEPLVVTIKSTPVASFIILALVWFSSKGLSIFIPAVIIFPPFYLNMKAGLENADIKLLEMAQVFRVPFNTQFRSIYVPACLPHLRAAASLGLGLCWKSGIAAEIISLPKGTTGFSLYQAKVYLETPAMFAWTLVIVLCSIMFEKFFMWLFDKTAERMVGYEA